MSQFNHWKVSYSAISLLEDILEDHVKVRSFKRSKDILFHISLKNDLKIKAVLVNEYCLGLAAIHRVLKEFPGVEYIVTSANWNGYTREAKIYGKKNELGIFILSEFIGALHWENPKEYVQMDEEGKPVYHYKSP